MAGTGVVLLCHEHLLPPVLLALSVGGGISRQMSSLQRSQVETFTGDFSFQRSQKSISLQLESGRKLLLCGISSYLMSRRGRNTISIFSNACDGVCGKSRSCSHAVLTLYIFVLGC